jgi:hypothetical protein
MAPTGHTYHFPDAPEFYLVDDHLHVVDRIKGEVALHRIYPATALGTLSERTRHVKNAAKLLEILARPLKPKKNKKDRKSRKCK